MTNFVNVDLAADAPAAEPLGHGESEGHGEGHGEESSGHGGGHGGGGGYGGDGHGTGHGSGHGGAEGNSGSRHSKNVNSFGIVREGLILPAELSKWMQQIGQLKPEHGTIFRIKAIMAIKDHPYKHVFHAVMDVSDEDDAGEWEEGEKKISKIIFIGKNLDQEHLRAGYEAIFEK